MRHCGQRAFTIVELLVVLAIFGILMALVLPAVMMVRENARQTECRNHLRQLGMAMHLHHEAQGHFPTNGWGFQWAGDPERGFGESQPGGWVFNLLPYLEQEALRNRPQGMPPSQKRAAIGEVLQVPLAVFQCPVRRAPAPYAYTEMTFPLYNSVTPTIAAKSDYAICAGDQVIDGCPGPASVLPSDVTTYSWPDSAAMTGVSFIRSRVRFADIADGLSNTVMIGEKYISRDEYNGLSLGDDQSMYIGDDADIRRWTAGPPLADTTCLPDIQSFGSAHPQCCFLVFCDGSVRSATYVIDLALFRRVGNRRDGQSVDLSRFP